MFKLLVQFWLFCNFFQFSHAAGDVPKPNRPAGQIDRNRAPQKQPHLNPFPSHQAVSDSPAEASANLSNHQSSQTDENAATASFSLPSPQMPLSKNSKGKAIIDSSSMGKGKEMSGIEIGGPRISEIMPPSNPNQAEQLDPALEEWIKGIGQLKGQIDAVEENMKLEEEMHSAAVPNEIKNAEPHRVDLEWDFIAQGYELQLPYQRQISALKRNWLRILEQMISNFALNPQVDAWKNERKQLRSDVAVMARRIRYRVQFIEKYRRNDQQGQRQQALQQTASAANQSPAAAAAEESSTENKKRKNA